ncbi:alpha/beta fold hydrolase [Nocardia sp. NPDC057353]|uniref:alpha/beta fold hydrolase n=1 Tax=Nocardia sp. NPDC057353 TaxID=3346104 RepID=UPI00362A4AEF
MTDSEQPARRRWRRVRAIAVVTAVAAAAVALLVRTPAPIGHWDDAAGHDRFRAAYDTAFAALPTPARTLDIRTDHGVVRVYRFTGARPAARPFVLLPGRASATPVWADNLPGLLELGDVYTVDLLGEPGMSIQERPITGDADHAAWLHQTLAALPEEAVHVVGLSIGGWTAVNLALHDPTHVATLTLIDPVHVFDDLPLGTIVRSLPAALPWLPKSWRDGFNSYTAGGAPVEDEPTAAMIEAGMRHYRLELPAPTRIGEDRLAGLRPPVLAIIAGRSVMHDPATAVATARRALPGAAVRCYPDASHAINGERPAEIAADIAEFTGAHP